MQVYRGERRLFETLIEEENTSTSTSRTITIPGVTRYSEIENCIIPVKAYAIGSAATTYVRVAGLTYKELKIFYDNATPTAPSNIWIYPGQVYQLVYNGTYFTLIRDNANTINQIVDNNINQALSQAY